MEETSILNICPFADSYIIYIPPYNCIEPNTGVFPDFNISYNLGTLLYKYSLMNLWQNSLKWLYHIAFCSTIFRFPQEQKHATKTLRHEDNPPQPSPL